MLDEIALRGTQNNTYKLVNKLKEELFDDKVTTSSKFDLEVQNDFKALHIMHWLPKVCKAPTGAIFNVVSKKCCTEALSKAVTQNFELIFKQI